MNLFTDLSSRLGGSEESPAPAPRHIWSRSRSEHLAEFHQPHIFHPWHCGASMSLTVFGNAGSGSSGWQEFHALPFLLSKHRVSAVTWRNIEDPDRISAELKAGLTQPRR